MRHFIKLFIILGLASCSIVPEPEPYKNQISPNLKEVSYSKLDGWRDDDLRYAVKAFKRSCLSKQLIHPQFYGKIVANNKLLLEKCSSAPSEKTSIREIRKWFEDNFQPYQIYSDEGKDTGLFTGYYSPVIKASKKKSAEFNEPLMAVPQGKNFKGVPRKTIVDKKLGKPLYWANKVDVQNIQIQGSGLIKLENGKLVKLNFAGHNDLPFKSIGAELKKRNITPAGGHKASAVWEHLKKNPKLADELIDANQRYIFFKEAVEHDAIGKLNVPLTKIRSIAVDDSLYTLGLPMFIDTKLANGKNFQRLMMAQDTGSAIRGWIRADIFFGFGEEAEQFASPQYSQGKMYVLLPKAK